MCENYTTSCGMNIHHVDPTWQCAFCKHVIDEHDDYHDDKVCTECKYRYRNRMREANLCDCDSCYNRCCMNHFVLSITPPRCHECVKA